MKIMKRFKKEKMNKPLRSMIALVEDVVGYPIEIHRCDINNDAAVAGRDEILIGTFDDPEWEMAAVAHELGHIIDFNSAYRNTSSQYVKEYIAWCYAKFILRLVGVSWNGNIEAYKTRCLSTYTEGGD